MPGGGTALVALDHEVRRKMTIYGKSEAIYAGQAIEHLGLNTRTCNALKRQGVSTIGEVLDLTVRELLDIRNLGANSTGHLVGQLEILDLAERVTILEREVREIRGVEGEK
jgi:DNA-directed RNA polymerase alpha subunit